MASKQGNRVPGDDAMREQAQPGAQKSMEFIESVSTAGIPPTRRPSFWSDAIGRVFTQLEARPRDKDAFNASLSRRDFGDISLARVVSSGCSVEHTDFRARKVTEQVFLVHLQAVGESLNLQNGREALIRTGDFTLCSSSDAYALRFDTLNDMLVMRIPSEQLRARISGPENFTAVTIPGNQGVGSLVSQTLLHWWSLCAGGLDEQVSQRIAVNTLDLLVTALCAHRPAAVAHSSITNAHRLRIHAVIESMLCDPDLSVERIAAVVKVTPRYVNRLMEQSGETVGARILRRRLELSARRLHDPALSGHSVTEIAFDCAFVDASYFTRCFKRKYGMTPREHPSRRCSLQRLARTYEKGVHQSVHHKFKSVGFCCV